MNPLTHFKKMSIMPLLITSALLIGHAPGTNAADLRATPVIDWSNEARQAIVPVTAGSENYGNKFPGEAAVYMGIVHAAIYDAALAIEGGYQPDAIRLTAPMDTSPKAAIATAAHHTLIGLQPALGLTPAQQAILDGDYTNYMAAIPNDSAKANGIMIGEQVATAYSRCARTMAGIAIPRLATSIRQHPAPVFGSPTRPGWFWVCGCRESDHSRSQALRSFVPTAPIR